MTLPAYCLQKHLLKYYIIPNVGHDVPISGTEGYSSYYFKSNAEKTLDVMNAAWNEGFRYCLFFGGK